MIFGVVTAEIAKEFAEALRCHDRRKVFEDVVSRSGVTLFMSDDKKDIRLQGKWDNVKDAHDLLEGEYGEYAGLPKTGNKYNPTDGCGQPSENTITRPKRLSSWSSNKALHASTTPEKNPPLPDGAIRVPPYPTKSSWKQLKKWPKAPDPLIIIEGGAQGSGTIPNQSTKEGGKDLQEGFEAANPAKSYEETDEQLNHIDELTKHQPENVDSMLNSDQLIGKDRKLESNSSALSETLDEDHNDDNDDNNDDDDYVPEGEKVVTPEKTSSKSPVVLSPIDDWEPGEIIPLRAAKTKSGPQTRGNKRKAGRPRKIPVKIPSSDDEEEDDSDLEYKAPPKRSRRKRRQPVRKSLRRRVPSRRQGTVPPPPSDEPVVKRKRGRPRKVEATVDLNCPDCDFVAKTKIQLRSHKQRLHGASESGSFTCSVCEKQFSFEKDMKRHMLRHVDTRYPCDVCGRLYKDRKTMMTHKERHKEGWVQPTFSCDQCSKSFCTKYILTNHIKSEHLGLKRMFLCPTCGKSFTQKHAYLQHANVHLGIKPFVCDICNKAFAYEKSLKEHKFMHFEEKTFVCNVCSKAFRQKSALVVHAKIHKPTKDFLCSVCSKGFTQKQALLRHERVHNGEKPFACGVCGRSFSDKSIIRRHMILVHKRDSKQWKENTFEEKKERSDYFVTPKMQCDVDEEPLPSTASVATTPNPIPSNPSRNLPQQTPPVPPPTVSLEQREPVETVPISPASTPQHLPQMPMNINPNNSRQVPSHSEENLHPAHSGISTMLQSAPLFNSRELHELRDIRDIPDMRDMRQPDMRSLDMHLRDPHMRGDVRDLHTMDMRDMRTSDVRDLRVPVLRDHPKVSSLTDVRDMRVTELRDMRLPDMRDMRTSHGDLRDLRDLSRDGHLSVPPMPSPVQDLTPVTTHSVADLSPSPLSTTGPYASSLPSGISTHHVSYPSSVTSPSPMPVHHYPYMYSNMPQSYDPHSGSYVPQPQMNYYQ